MTDGQLAGYGIAILVGVGLAIAGTIWAILADGKRRRAEYDSAWKTKRAELERNEAEK